MPAPDVSSYAQRFGLTVTPENVLGIREVVLDEAHRLQETLDQQKQNVWLPELGGDPVSKDMSREFNSLTRGLLKRAQQHVDILLTLCDELATTARDYGHTEAQIVASFARTDVSRLPPLFKRAAGLNTASGQTAGPTSWQGLITGDQA